MAKTERPQYAGRQSARPSPSSASGTMVTSGLISSIDPNVDLQGAKWYGEYGKIGISGKMLRDAHVRMSLSYVFNPLLAATWRFKAASKEPIDREIADAATWAFVERLPWTSILRMLVRGYGADGFALREITDDVLPFPANRFPHHAGGGSGVLPTGVLDIPANTVYRWHQSQQNSRKLRAITQYVPSSDVDGYGLKEISADRLLRISYEQEGANFPGLAILRSAYGPWAAKHAFETIRAIKHNRLGIGEPIATAAEDASDDELDAVELILANLHAHEKGYAVLPPGWTVNWFGSTQSDGTNIDQAIAACCIDIALNVACGFQMLGVKSTSGTYGLGETQTGAYHLAEVGHAKLIEDAWTIGFDDFSPVRRFVDLNYGTQYPTPRLQALYLPTRSWDDVIKNLVPAVQAKIVTPDGELEDEAREILQLGQRDDEGAREQQDAAIASPSITEQAAGDLGTGDKGNNDNHKDASPDETTPKELQTIFGYHLQYGVAKINEARSNLNLPAVPYGDQTVPEFLASLMTSNKDPAARPEDQQEEQPANDA